MFNNSAEMTMLAAENKALTENGQKWVFAAAQAYQAAGMTGAQAMAAATRDYGTALDGVRMKQMQLAAGNDPFKNMKVGLQQFVNETKNSGQQMQQMMTTALDGVAKGFAKTIVEGKNLSQSMRQVGIQMAESFVEMEVKRLMAHILTELGITSATVTGAATRDGVEKTTASQSIMKSAKSAAAKAYDSMSDIPVVGPILGAIAAAAVVRRCDGSRQLQRRRHRSADRTSEGSRKRNGSAASDFREGAENVGRRRRCWQRHAPDAAQYVQRVSTRKECRTS